MTFLIFITPPWTREVEITKDWRTGYIGTLPWKKKGLYCTGTASSITGQFMYRCHARPGIPKETSLEKLCSVRVEEVDESKTVSGTRNDALSSATAGEQMERRSTEKPRGAVRAQREIDVPRGLKPKLFNMTTLTLRPSHGSWNDDALWPVKREWKFPLTKVVVPP